MTTIRPMKPVRLVAATLLMLGAGLLQAAHAQAPGIHRTDLVQQAISVPGNEAVQVRVDFDAGAFAPAHTHPGEEVAYVLEGTLEYRLEGRAPVTLKAGQALFIPSGVAHSARNVGTGKASELATYIVKQGAPLVELKK